MGVHDQQYTHQGHGYFRPKPRSEFVNDMASKMNGLVAVANSAISAGNTAHLGFSMRDGNRFEVVRPVGAGGGWAIYYHRGMGTDPGLAVDHTGLRRFSASDFPNPFAAPGSTAIWVRRPIESRRESIGGSASGGSAAPGGGASPLPEPTAPVPAPTAPAPDIPTPAPPTSPPPLPTKPYPGSGTRTEPTPQPDGRQQQQQEQRQEQQHPEPTPPTKPKPTPAKPCSFTCSTPKLLGARTPQYKRGAGSRYFCESLFWASQPKQAAKT